MHLDIYLIYTYKKEEYIEMENPNEAVGAKLARKM